MTDPKPEIDPPATPSNKRILIEVLPDGNFKINEDDGITVVELFAASALIARRGNEILDGAMIVEAERLAAKTPRLVTPGDHLGPHGKRRN